MMRRAVGGWTQSARVPALRATHPSIAVAVRLVTAPREPPLPTVAAGGWQTGSWPRDRIEAIPATEASGAVTSVLAMVAGLGAGILYLGLKHGGGSSAGSRLEVLEPGDFVSLRTSPLSVVNTYCGKDASWCGTTLRLRLDDHRAIRTDATATLRLGGRFAPHGELVQVDASTARSLGSATADSGGIFGLRITDADPPPDIREGPAITIELTPGSGLFDLYGRPGLYSVQDDSSLKKGQLGRTGRYSPQDLYSGRPDRISRALAALAEQPQEDEKLRVFVNGERAFPATRTAGEEPSPQVPQTLATALQELGLRGLSQLLEILGLQLHSEGASLLTGLLRAQCGAGGGIPALACELREVLRRQSDVTQALEMPMSDEALDASLARGFWTLPADESGMHWREREAERLLERARRELWAKGSASRRELEAEIRKFLCRYLLGCAACHACLRLSIVRARGGTSTAERLRQLRYMPIAAVPSLWCRLDLVHLEVPCEHSISEDTMQSKRGAPVAP